MKKNSIFIIGLLICQALTAQEIGSKFHAYLYNKEYHVYMRINFDEQNIIIPGQELLGEVPGYLGKDDSSFFWPVIDTKIKNNTATITMINDYGSEDLSATLTYQNDSTYILKQGKGSALKVVDNGKWLKLPTTLIFHRKTKK